MAMIIFFNGCIDKRDVDDVKMNQYFPRLYEPFAGDISVQMDLSNYATQADLKGATRVDTSKLAIKSNLAK